jgi:hypothetical protein
VPRDLPRDPFAPERTIRRRAHRGGLRRHPNLRPERQKGAPLGAALNG